MNQLTPISANLVQPLLRGAGSRIPAENLTQSERNVIYEIRSFSRYQIPVTQHRAFGSENVVSE